MTNSITLSAHELAIDKAEMDAADTHDPSWVECEHCRGCRDCEMLSSERFWHWQGELETIHLLP